MKVDTPSLKVERVLAGEAVEGRRKVAGSIEVQTRAVVLPSGKLLRVRVGRTRGASCAERIERVLRLNRSRAVGHGDRRAEGIAEQSVCSRSVRSPEHIVDQQTRQQVRRGCSRSR